MSIAVIADAHLGGPGGTADAFIEQLEELPASGCRRLIFLGDIFHVWIGSHKFATPEIRRVTPALRRLREQGIRLDYIEGNRDFFLADSPYAEIFDHIGTELAFELGGVRYLAVHGDGLNDRDRQYLFWRWLSKSAVARSLILHLPSALARHMVHKAEHQLAKTNFKHKTRIPEEAILRFATRRLGVDCDVVFLGHFHEPRTWHLEGGQVRLVDAWFNRHHIEWLTADAPR